MSVYNIEEIFERYFEIRSAKCCKRKTLLNVNGEVLCKFCGQVSHYEMMNESGVYNRYQVKKKSKYQRKYYMNNILQTKIEQNYIDFSVKEMNEFIRIFNKVASIFFELYPSRKRIIKFDFIFPEILPFIKSDASKLFSNNISKATAKKYNEIWNNIKANL